MDLLDPCRLVEVEGSLDKGGDEVGEAEVERLEAGVGRVEAGAILEFLRLDEVGEVLGKGGVAWLDADEVDARGCEESEYGCEEDC